MDFESINALDEQIKILLDCKPLPESQVKTLCEKVSINSNHRKGTLSDIIIFSPSKIAPSTHFKRLGCSTEFLKRDIFEQLLNFEFSIGQRNPY